MTAASGPELRRNRWRRGALACLVAASLILLVGIPLAGPIAHASRAAHELEYGRSLPRSSAVVPLATNATDAPAFDPSTLRGASAGETVNISLDNVGNFTHSFTVLSKLNYRLPPALTPAELDAWFAANGSLANVSLAPGAHAWANFTLPANSTGGSFEFVSTVPYQFQAGMFGVIDVSAGGPSVVLQETSTGALQFVPNTLVVNSSAFPVVIEVVDTNAGSLFHTWTLSALPGVFLTPDNFTSYFQKHPPLENLQIPATDGAVVNGTFVVNAPGVYEYICEAPGHFANGMNGTLWVGVAPPAPPAPLSTAVVQAGVLVGAGVLVLVGVLLALSANFVGRFPPRPRGHG